MKVSGDVAALFHIDPDDHPKAGVPSQAWFALMLIGGNVIPLSQCKCEVDVYPTPIQEGKTLPLLKPQLKAISVESYQNIPSTVITFPKPGIYELRFTGKPLSGNKFRPFKLSYEVTVAN